MSLLALGLARGMPIVIVGTAAGSLVHLRHTGAFTRSFERLGGVLMLAAAAYFFYQAAIFAGWIAPITL